MPLRCYSGNRCRHFSCCRSGHCSCRLEHSPALALANSCQQRSNVSPLPIWCKTISIAQLERYAEDFGGRFDGKPTDNSHRTRGPGNLCAALCGAGQTVPVVEVALGVCGGFSAAHTARTRPDVPHRPVPTRRDTHRPCPSARGDGSNLRAGTRRVPDGLDTRKSQRPVAHIARANRIAWTANAPPTTHPPGTMARRAVRLYSAVRL